MISVCVWSMCVCGLYHAWSHWMGLDMANSSALALTGLNTAQSYSHTYICTSIFVRTLIEIIYLLAQNPNYHNYCLTSTLTNGGRSSQNFYSAVTCGVFDDQWCCGAMFSRRTWTSGTCTWKSMKLCMFLPVVLSYSTDHIITQESAKKHKNVSEIGREE